jgi:hypothetical protein
MEERWLSAPALPFSSECTANFPVTQTNADFFLVKREILKGNRGCVFYFANLANYSGSFARSTACGKISWFCEQIRWCVNTTGYASAVNSKVSRRSLQAVISFYDIGTVAASGNSSVSHRYVYRCRHRNSSRRAQPGQGYYLMEWRQNWIQVKQ